MTNKKLYVFGGGKADGQADLKNMLGGKGANLADMAKMGFPVPPGMTIPTTASLEYLKLSASERGEYAHDWLTHVVTEADKMHKKFGHMPLFSVRSGARVSMPGMMDTILNVGLTTTNLTEWMKRIGERAALDSYRRLIQMLGSVALDVPHQAYEQCMKDVKDAAGVTEDKDLKPEYLAKLADKYLTVTKAHGKVFPQTLESQLEAAIVAVWNSWNNERAKTYRKMNGYSEDWGTAVTVQTMVFGNLNDQSCSGVLFTRNPSTGENTVMGEFLPNAQGEDVVAGIRTPFKLDEMKKWNAKVYAELMTLVGKLETNYRDMQDVEFTVQDGELFLLQTRNGKRSAEAAFKIGFDLVKSKMITAAEMKARVTAKQFASLRVPKIAKEFTAKPDGVGYGAGGGAVKGKVVFTAEAAVQSKDPTILLRKETTPDDIKGMAAAVGILTQTGGATSHAAVVARGMDRTCVVGLTALTATKAGYWTLNGQKIYEGTVLTIDGATGNVWIADAPIQGGTYGAEATEFMTELANDAGGVAKVEYTAKNGALVNVYVPECRNVLIETAALDQPMYGEQVQDMLTTILHAVKQTPSVEKVYVDLRIPSDLLGATDMKLFTAFGVTVDESIYTDKVAAVTAVFGKEPGKAVLTGIVNGDAQKAAKGTDFAVTSDVGGVIGTLGELAFAIL